MIERYATQSDDTLTHRSAHARVCVCTHSLYKYVENAHTLVSVERRTETHDFADERMTRDNFGHACKSTRKFKTSVMAPSFVHLLAGSFKSVDLFIPHAWSTGMFVAHLI